MKILAFNTSDSQLSIALNDGATTLAAVEILEDSKQAESLIVEVEKILTAQNIWYQDLDVIATIKGPGSFTGIRIGLVFAKTIKLATRLPLFTFDSLVVLAHANKDFSGKIFVIIDAKMDEFFIGEFCVENGEVKIVQESRLAQLEELQDLNLDENHLIIGSGKEILHQIFAQKNVNLKIGKKSDKAQAAEIALMAFASLTNGDSQSDSNPLYLRQPRISERKK